MPSKPVTLRSSGTRSPRLLCGLDRAERQQVGLRDDRGGAVLAGDVQQPEGRQAPLLEVEEGRLHHGRVGAEDVDEAAGPVAGVRVVRLVEG